MIFSQYLAEPYTNKDIWNNIPGVLLWLENISLFMLFVLTLQMPLKIKTTNQRVGLLIYFIGLLVYLLVWRELILYPNGDWASSLFGFTSLSYTPFIMLFGIGLISKNSFLKFRFHRFLYAATAIIFIIFYTWHAIIVFQLVS